MTKESEEIALEINSNDEDGEVQYESVGLFGDEYEESQDESDDQKSSNRWSLLSKFNVFSRDGSKHDVYTPNQYPGRLTNYSDQNIMLQRLDGQIQELFEFAVESHPQFSCSFVFGEQSSKEQQLIYKNPRYIDEITYGMPLRNALTMICARERDTDNNEKKHYKFLDMAIEKIEAHLFADRPWLYGHSTSTKMIQGKYYPFKVKLARKLGKLIREDAALKDIELPNVNDPKYDAEYKDQYVEDMFKEFKAFMQKCYLVGATAIEYQPKSNSWFSRSKPNE